MLLCPKVLEHPRKGKTGQHRKEHFFKNKNIKTPNIPKKLPSGVTHTCESHGLHPECFWDQPEHH